MSEFQILLTVILVGFGIMGLILLIIWNQIGRIDSRISQLENDMNSVKTLMRIFEGRSFFADISPFHKEKLDKKAQ